MRLTIGKKLGLSFAVVFTLSVLVCCFSYMKLNSLASLQHDTSNRQLDIYTTAWDVRAANQLAVAQLGEYMALAGTGERNEKVRQDWEQALERLDKDITKLQSFSYKKAENRALVEKLAKLLPEYRQAQQRVMDAASRGGEGLKQAGEIFKSQEIPRAAEMRAIATDLVKGVSEVMRTAGEEIDSSASETKWTLLLGTLFSITIGSVLLMVVSRRIVRALEVVLGRANEIAAGDLTGKQIESSSNDEIADLTVAMNQMQQRLADVLQNIEQNAQTVASASEEISASATQSANGSQTQSDQTAQVATAVQQMSATVTDISDNTTSAADAARRAVETAKRGGTVVQESLVNMRSIASSVLESAKKVEELGKSSDQIGRIIAVIDDIADQTNLLALNAAIEAARAGEQGRGFAVVADEVRKLAERTTTATKEIAQMIETVQHETRNAVDQMNAGTKQVESGVRTTTAAGESLQDIIREAEQVGDMVSQIASAAAEQASTTEQIRANVGSIAKITQESAIGAQQSAKACEDLSQLAMDLQQLVAQFKLAGSAANRVSHSRVADNRLRSKDNYQSTSGYSERGSLSVQ